MELVRCISDRETNKGQITVGKKYWVDTSSSYKDGDGDEYVDVYLEEAKKNFVGRMLREHFEIIYRYLNYGSDLSYYVNTHQGLLLKDIILWCSCRSFTHSLAKNVLKYITNNGLDIEENMEKEYVVNHIPFKEFVNRGKAEEYHKYMGYSLYCID
ncbi:MAG: hypothetical protein NC131_13525 [Roseburia sp.]|nr:hypothetical protein [Roseburia sp.]